ncbi:MAG: hypothetical protein J0H78_10580 [Rhizobiales bacterium]|mgnify:CR=1 FL=1|nr:hypothetical protein [Hyphomicrobiales bacterium]OJY46486.1 MAG: hypothetical protein BGP08_15625 [Rhizobiales bacterium 64-17]
MVWNHADTPLLAKALELAIEALRETERLPENAAIMRNAIREAIESGTTDLEALVEIGARSLSR